MSDQPITTEDADAIGRSSATPAAAPRGDSDVRFRSLVAAINSVVVILGEDYRILEWNPEAERVYGWSRDEVLGKDYLEMFLPEDVRPAIEADLRKVLGGEETRGFENPVVSRDGTPRIVQWNVRRLPDGEGQTTVLACGHDITEHRRSRERLERSEAELKAILDNAPITVFAKDLAGRFTMTNRNFDDAFPFGRGFALGKMDADFLPPEVARQNRTNDLIALEKDAPIEFEEHVPVREELRSFLGFKFPLRDAQGRPYAVCGIMSDITALRRAEEERAALQLRIIEAQREALRDLSTPLLPIAGGVVLMPLVGAIDEGRAALVLEALLEGVVAHRAEVAILDITGIHTVDADVARGLVQAAHAAGLLGAEVILTGVRPAAARTLVDLGIDMHGIKTLGSLEQGVAHAIARSGRRARPGALLR